LKSASHKPILAGLRIIELTAFVAAPLCGATLASLGADVIRIDPPGGGIDAGRWPLHKGQSLYWAGLNQGKRSITIDTRSETGREQVAKLISASGDEGGIFLTNLPLSEWNSFEALSRRRHDLIMVVISGRRDGAAAVDYTVNAGLGFPFVTGPEGYEGPVNHVLPAWDVATGYLAATAILAAERHRRLTGEGQLIELSLADVGLAVTAHLGLLAEAELVETPRARFGNYVFGTFGRDFTTRDGRALIVLALTPRQWRSIGDATGLNDRFDAIAMELGLDFRDEGDRWRGRERISAELAAWMADRDLSEVSSSFERAGVLWGPYQTFKEAVAREAADSPMSAEVEHPAIGRHIAMGSPLRFSAASNLPAVRGPLQGEQTVEVFEEFGLDA
jgi:2-methylfumaryl-CoA isomerase